MELQVTVRKVVIKKEFANKCYNFNGTKGECRLDDSVCGLCDWIPSCCPDYVNIGSAGML